VGNFRSLGKRMTFSGATPSSRRRVASRLAGLGAVAALALAGCHTPAGHDRGSVAGAVESRFGSPAGPPAKPCPPGEVLIPEGLAEGRPLSEEQAVVLALWNNAAFLEALVELDLTRADLVQAGLLPNPEVFYSFPIPDRAFRYLVDFPLEAFWLRPIRVKATAAENERAAARLTQLALDLIRDSRQAHADLHLAHDRVKVAQDAVELRNRIVGLAEARLKAGDASALEVSTAKIDALQAGQDLTRLGFEVRVAEERLRNLTGLSDSPCPLNPDAAPFDPRTDLADDELVNEAVAARPDAVAADHAVRAAIERLRVARLGWVRFLGILDATSGQVTGHEFGPAFRMTLPIFNRNQGGIARAEAELEQLDRRRQTVHNQIVLDVRTALARYRQARAELDFLREKTRPEVGKAIERAEAAYKEGNATILLVLEANRQLIDTDARAAQLRADLRRAWAELERAVGRRLQ
jgi:cobalt-zinc-cadmium efflux system outer membrane protein